MCSRQEHALLLQTELEEHTFQDLFDDAELFSCRRLALTRHVLDSFLQELPVVFH